MDIHCSFLLSNIVTRTGVKTLISALVPIAKIENRKVQIRYRGNRSRLI